MKKILLIILLATFMFSTITFADSKCNEKKFLELKNMETRGYFGIGTKNLNVDDLNNRLKTGNFVTYKKTMVSVIGGEYFKKNRLIFGGEGGALFSLEEDGASESKYNTSLVTLVGSLKVGYDLTNSKTFSIYPSIGLGIGATCLSFEEKEEISFDEIIKNPSKSVRLINYNLLVDLGFGIDKMLTFRKNEKGFSDGFLIGLQTGYTLGIPLGGWFRALDDDSFSSIKVPNGPDFSVTGPYIRFTIGGGKTTVVNK